MKRYMHIKVLALAVLSVGRAAAALDDDPAEALVPQVPGEHRVEQGVRVRVRTALLVEIPGVARVGSRIAEGRRLVADEENQVVTVSTGQASEERISLPRPGATFVGQVVSLDDSTLLIALDGKSVQVTIPRSAVADLDVSLGRTKRRGRAKSALLGVAIGGGGRGASGLRLGRRPLHSATGRRLLDGLG